MDKTPGVTVMPYGNGIIEYLVRGYRIDQFLFDGLNSRGRGVTQDSLDTAIFDHIEILKGPSGLINGSGEPSGSINMLRKKALKDFKAQGALSGGSWNSYRGEFDITSGFDENGNFRGRLVGVYDRAKSYIDEAYANKSVFYGTLEYDFTQDTTLSIGGIYQNGKSMPNFGLPTGDGYLLNLKRSTFLGDKWNEQSDDLKRYFLDLEHYLSNGGEIRVATDYINRKSKMKTSAYGDTFPDKNGNMDIMQYKWDNEYKDFSIDAYLSTPFELFNHSHNILIGASHDRVKDLRSSVLPGSIFKNVSNLAHNTPEPNWGLKKSWDYNTKSNESGIYGQIRYKIVDDLTMIGGGRFAWVEQISSRIDDKNKINAKLIPYAGIIYDINNEYSIYTSYSQIFAPQGEINVKHEFLKPRIGSQYEIGAKASLFDGGLNAQVAIFRINDENRAVEDPNNPRFSVALGKVRSQGGEIEVSGSIIPWWDILAGYTYTATKYLVSDESEQGKIFAPNTPKHSLKLWSSHNIRDFKLGYGMITSSGIFVEDGTKKLQGGYAIFSVMLGYKINKNFELAFNMDNIFDHKYWIRTDMDSRQNYYGDPRNFTLSLRGRY